MKLIESCGLGQCPRILEDTTGSYIVVGEALSLKEHAGLQTQFGEKAVRIPRDVMVEAARVIMLQLAQD